MVFSFPGGLHLKDNKQLTKDIPIKDAPLPKKVIIPLSQSMGPACTSVVNEGDSVKKGQIIGDCDKPMGVPVHASTSGKVISVKPHLVCSGSSVMSVTIEADGKDELHEAIKPFPLLNDLIKSDIKLIARNAGIVGLGGAVFPTHIKLDPPFGKKINTVILNGAECEPYITCDHRMMIERSEDVFFGLKAIMRAVGAVRGIIAIEQNKPDAIRIFEGLAAKEMHIKVAKLRAKYPQGGEKQIIKAVMKREVPSGGLPADAGVIVNNVGTAAAISEAIHKGVPLIERVITVSGGAIKLPSNIRVRIGTSLEEVIGLCGGFVKQPKKVIIGGPMMGVALQSLDIPVTKNINSVLALSEEETAIYEERDCIRCAKCVDICPVFLWPVRLGELSMHQMFDEAEKIGAMDCIECGLCSYVCPSRIELVHHIKLAKQKIAGGKQKK